MTTETGYEVKTLDEVVDAESNTAAELFESTPAFDNILVHSHPYGVRIVDRDVNEVVSLLRFTKLALARAYFAELVRK